MAEYTIKTGQNGIDISNQIYGNQNSIGQIYLDNPEFDINQMQTDDTITYDDDSELIDTNIVNEIARNEYVFKNFDEQIYEEVLSILCYPGIANPNQNVIVTDNENILFEGDNGIYAYGNSPTFQLLQSGSINIKMEPLNYSTVGINLSYSSSSFNLLLKELNLVDDIIKLTYLNLSSQPNAKYFDFSNVTSNQDGITLIMANCFDNALLSEVESFLDMLNGTGWINGTLNMLSTNFPSGIAGLSSYAALVGNGWTILS